MTDLIQIKEVAAGRVPMDLLLQADPSKVKVKSYLRQSRCFIAILKGQAVGACVVKQISAGVHELMNIFSWSITKSQSMKKGFNSKTCSGLF